MRLICVSLVVASLCLLVECFAPANAAFECGTFDGKFSCRSSPGAAPHGKNAPPPGTDSPPPAETPPSGEGQLPPPTGGETGGGSSVTPGPAGCPPSTELLGGKCVHYTATCRQPMGASSLVQACAGTEEKLVCKPRGDGMKECCCLVYDRL